MDKDNLSQEEKLNKKLNESERNFSKSPLLVFSEGASFLRVGTEFIAGVIAGVIVGLIVDHFFTSAPWGLIFFFFLGSCSGFFNVYRVCKKMKK